MGSGRDKRKKAKGHTPGAGADKTARKTEAKAERKLAAAERRAAAGGDDIDALLEAFRLEDAARAAVVVEDGCAPPSPRVYASFVPRGDAATAAEAVVFGGEHYDAARDRTAVYADLYTVDLSRRDAPAWRRVASPGGPPPRSSHQAAVTPNGAAMYVFGGEFTSPNHERFRHYGDLWRLELGGGWRWEQLPSRGGPSPRSGHRMLLHRGRLLLFGGFFDAGRETRYFNDAWAYSLQDMKWTCLLAPGAAGGAPAPAPRGGCQLALLPGAGGAADTLFVFGGYSVRRAEPDAAAGGRKAAAGKKGGAPDDGVGVVHDDVWALDLTALRWERVKKAGLAPGARASFGGAQHRARFIQFGGVFDREGAGDRLFSELFNEAFQFDLPSRRWYPLAVRPPPRRAGAAGAGAAGAAGQPGVSAALAAAHAAAAAAPPPADAARHAAATRIQAHFRGHRVRAAYRAFRLGGAVSELLYSPALYGVDLSAPELVKPRARAAPMLLAARGVLWLWGGQVEVAHADVVLDDLWSLDLGRLDGWRCARDNTAGEAAFRELSDWETGSSGGSDEEEEGG